MLDLQNEYLALYRAGLDTCDGLGICDAVKEEIILLGEIERCKS